MKATPGKSVDLVQFVVHGVPAPQAGTRSVPTRDGRRQISTGGVELASWRAECASAAGLARFQHRGVCFDEPITVQAHFRFPMPPSRPRWMRDLCDYPKATQPDLDKLQRALGDALKSGGLIRDDSIIVEWRASKTEVWQQWTGVAVLIKTLSEDDE